MENGPKKNGRRAGANHTLKADSIVVAAKDQICCDLAGEAVILGLRSGKYYGLNAVGAHIWSLIQQPVAVREIRDALIATYEVEADCCEREIRLFLNQLAAEKVIEIRDEAGA